MPPYHLHLCHSVHMSYQTVSDLPGRHSFQTVSATPPSFSPSPVKREPNYADAARSTVDRAHPEHVTWMCIHAWHSTKAEACPEPVSLYMLKICAEPFCCPFSLPAKWIVICWHAVSLNASGVVTQNNFNNSFYFKNVWQQGPKQMCLTLLIALYKSIWKHSYYILRDKSKFGHHTSLCGYSGELEKTSTRGGNARYQGLQPPALDYSHSPWGWRILLLTVFPLSSQTLLFCTPWWITCRRLGGRSLCGAWAWATATWSGLSWSTGACATPSTKCSGCGSCRWAVLPLWSASAVFSTRWSSVAAVTLYKKLC